MSGIPKTSQQLLEDFIRAYQNHPCLWRIKSKDYHDKAKKDAAYDVLLQKYKLIDSNADKGAVVRKINSIRTNYRKEKKKVEESRKIGGKYQPKLWYYHLFEFLENHSIVKSSSSNFNGREVSNRGKT